MRLIIMTAGLSRPMVNRPVTAASGRILAIPDLSYPRARVALEYDGDLHRTDRATWQRDVARRRALESVGWRIVTATARDLDDPTDLLRAMRAALRRRSSVK